MTTVICQIRSELPHLNGLDRRRKVGPQQILQKIVVNSDGSRGPAEALEGDLVCPFGKRA